MKQILKLDNHRCPIVKRKYKHGKTLEIIGLTIGLCCTESIEKQEKEMNE